MEPDTVINLVQEALKVTLLLSAPMLISSLVIGILVAIFQAVTQINEVTLTFIPKILIIAISIVVTAPWLIQVITQFTTALYEQIPMYIK